jgi:hypothetical protein
LLTPSGAGIWTSMRGMSLPPVSASLIV